MNRGWASEFALKRGIRSSALNRESFRSLMSQLPRRSPSWVMVPGKWESRIEHCSIRPSSNCCGEECEHVCHYRTDVRRRSSALASKSKRSLTGDFIVKYPSQRSNFLFVDGDEWSCAHGWLEYCVIFGCWVWKLFAGGYAGFRREIIKVTQ